MFRFLFRWIFRLLVVVILAATALLLSKEILIREWILYRLGYLTGLECRLGSVNSGWLAGTLTLSNLQVFNSAEFGGGPLLTVPDLHLELDLAALRQRELRLRLGRVHIAEFNVVRNPQGQTNIFEAWKSMEQRANVLDAAAAGPPGFEFTGIETLNLTVGTIGWTDLSQPDSNREIRVGLTNEIVHNVKSASDLSPLVVRVALSQLGNALSEGLRGGPRNLPHR